MLIIIFLLFSVSFPLYTYNYLPVKDFRPYAIGKKIQDGMILSIDTKQEIREMTFIYEKDGKQMEFKPEQIKDLDSTYKYIDRKDNLIQEADQPPIHDFSIASLDGSDYTEQILNYNGYYFFLVCYDLDKTNKDVFGKVNDLAKLCRADKVPIICLTATADRIESFKNETKTDIDFYVTDGTQLKTMIRSNPGLILLKQGTVMDMWHYHSLPSYSEVKEKHFEKK